jgi:protein phosphatase
VDAVNTRVFERKTALNNNMATTLALVRLRENTAWIALVGDSRVYLWRAGLLRRLTNDHSLAMELHEKGVLSAAEMENYPRRHVITRAIGAGATVAAEVQRLEIARSDVLLLCTDGLSAMLADQTICDFLRDSAGDTITRTATRLVHAANAAGGHDNITLILIKIR